MSIHSPLINTPLVESARRLYYGGGISFKGIIKLLFFYLQIFISIPFSFMQFLIFNQKIKKTKISKDAVFILGHYRSGTTYLHKLLASDQQFAYLTNYDALFANSCLLFGKKLQIVFQFLINRFQIKNPFFHNSIVLLSEPTEEDDFLMNKVSVYSAYWGLIFPNRWREWLNASPQLLNHEYTEGWKKEYINTIKFIAFKNSGKKLLLKSPPNTERIYLLLEIFPQAKFVFIYRNPYHMYYSIKNMWKQAILKYYSVQKITEDELDEIVFGHFVYLMDRYEEDKKLIPEANLIEISYEDLKADSFNTMQKIYLKLKLEGFDSASDELKAQLEHEEKYKNFTYEFSETTFKKIEAKWGKYINQWNYNRMDQ
ncbi:MAG: sulfotransferase [Bacteroidota bacterium]